MIDPVPVEPVVTLTESAVNQVKSLLAQDPSNQGKLLRLYVEKGGCSGLQYGIVFDEMRADDLTVESGGLSVVIDSFSANYLRGARVDYVDELTGGGFKVTNPNAKHSCGCGKSFDA
jgi:iron-sulfur cluster assembly accessory protein